MTNFEFYEDKMLELASEELNIGLYNGKPVACYEVGCVRCDLGKEECCNSAFIKWLYQEYEPPTDWSKVEVDTPILVSHNGENWERRHFAKYENGKVYVFISGTTSWTNEPHHLVTWKYAKLKVEE